MKIKVDRTEGQRITSLCTNPTLQGATHFALRIYEALPCQPCCPPMPESLWGGRMHVKGYDRKEAKRGKAFRGILN